MPLTVAGGIRVIPLRLRGTGTGFGRLCSNRKAFSSFRTFGETKLSDTKALSPVSRRTKNASAWPTARFSRRSPKQGNGLSWRVCIRIVSSRLFHAHETGSVPRGFLVNHSHHYFGKTGRTFAFPRSRVVKSAVRSGFTVCGIYRRSIWSLRLVSEPLHQERATELFRSGSCSCSSCPCFESEQPVVYLLEPVRFHDRS